MDAYVDSEIFSSAQNILNDINQLESTATMYSYSFDNAENFFDTVNYDNARACMATVEAAISQMKSNLDSVQKYLTQLRELIEKYGSLQY